MSYSARITANVNRNIAKGRRAIGKGSRQTTYQQIFRTRKEELLASARELRAVFRNPNARSRGEVSNQAKWFLGENSKASSSNHYQFQFLGTVLRDRSLSQSSGVLEEFIVFLLGNREFTAVIGDGIEAKAAVAKTVVVATTTDDEDFGWGGEMPTGEAAPAALNENEWGCGGNAASFSDEEDDM